MRAPVRDGAPAPAMDAQPAIPAWGFRARSGGGRFYCSAEEAELVAFGVGQDVPGLLAGLAHVGRAGAEGEEALEFLVLVAVDRVDVEVEGAWPAWGRCWG